MTARFRLPAVLLALFFLAACGDDPLDPCAEFGCGVEGVDLALVEAAIDWTADQGIDDRVGGRLVQPGDELAFRYRVLNRGTETSEPTVLELGTLVGLNNLNQPIGVVEVEVPALEPGEGISGRRVVAAPMSAGLRSDRLLAGFWLGGVLGGLFDADWTNHSREFRYHLASGYASVNLDASGGTLRPGESDSVWVAVANPSPVGELEGDLHIAFCALVQYPLYSPEPGCGETGFAVRPIPDLAPRGTDVYGLELTLPADALPIENFPVIGLRVCVFDGEPATGIDLTSQMTRGACADRAMPVVQDLDVACSPPVIALPETVDAASTESDCVRQFSTYDVWAFDAAESGLHTITMVAGDLAHLRVFGVGHERIAVNGSGEFFLPEAGRYHVVVLPSIAAHVVAIE